MDNHTVYMSKKWIGGGSQSSSLKTAEQRRAFSSINVDTPTNPKNYPNVPETTRALTRSRSGGAVVPKKVSQKGLSWQIEGYPTITKVETTNYISTVYYTPPPNINQGLISFYQYSLNNGKTWKHAGNSPLPFTISGLIPAEKYNIIIRACNNHAIGNPSTTFTFIAVHETPKDIANINLWLDANDTSTVILQSGYVNKWNDKTTTANNFTASTSNITYNPLTDNINGIPAIRFTTRQLSMLGTTQTFSGTNNCFTLFAVVDHTTYSGVLANSEIFIASNGYQHFDLFSNTGNGTNMLSINAGYSTQLSTGSNIIGTGANVICVVLEPTTCSVYLNGINKLNQIPKGTGDFYGLDETFAWRLSGAEFIGCMGEFITCPTTIDTNNRLKIEGYLAWKWRINDKLPLEHPYKNIPPP